MKAPTLYRVVREWPDKRLRHLVFGRIEARKARAMVKKMNAEERLNPRGTWLHINKRRGWLVIRYYEPGAS